MKFSSPIGSLDMKEGSANTVGDWFVEENNGLLVGADPIAGKTIGAGGERVFFAAMLSSIKFMAVFIEADTIFCMVFLPVGIKLLTSGGTKLFVSGAILVTFGELAGVLLDNSDKGSDTPSIVGCVEAAIT